MEYQKYLLYYFGFTISRILSSESLKNVCLPPKIFHQLLGVGRKKNYEDPILRIGIVTQQQIICKSQYFFGSKNSGEYFFGVKVFEGLTSLGLHILGVQNKYFWDKTFWYHNLLASKISTVKIF